MFHLILTLMTGLHGLGERLRRDDEGATAVEYGLMVALIAAAIIVTVGLLGTRLNDLFETVRQNIP